jgi:TolB-like protein/class 3 adenylate cyclase/Tfp pilus assembly protein PilF
MTHCGKRKSARGIISDPSGSAAAVDDTISLLVQTARKRKPVERRLAAVLIADVVGYSHLMEVDEEGTLGRLQSDVRELFEPKLAEHHGRLVKTTGDGLIAEFHSVVDALRSAIEIQRGEAERNITRPEHQRLSFRIGINLGDVIAEGGDLYGDGVNVAARLEGSAQAGQVMISGAAYEQVEKKLSVGFEFQGEQRVKNIDKPIRVYRVLTDPASAGKTVEAVKKPPRSALRAVIAALGLLFVVGAGAAILLRPWEPKFKPVLPLPDKPSIAVLPFTNMSGDPQQSYFADGMTDDLITDLSQISGLFVIARNSTFAYKGKVVDPRLVAQELGVRYVLEGSIQRSADQVRINAQLIDATTGGHEWADRYEGSLADIFGLQDKVTSSVADALALRLSPGSQHGASVRGTSVPAAYEAFLRGWELYRRTTPDDYAKAIPHLEDAIKLDPNYGRAYAALAMVYFSTYDRWWHESLGITYGEAQRRAQQYLAEAKTSPTSTSHQVAGNMLRSAGHSEQALDEFQAAIALDPSDSWNYAFLAETLNLAGRSLEAIPSIEKAMRLDPHYPADFLRILGTAQFQLEQFAEAAASLSRASAMNPDDTWSLAPRGNRWISRPQERGRDRYCSLQCCCCKVGVLPSQRLGELLGEPRRYRPLRYSAYTCLGSS